MLMLEYGADFTSLEDIRDLINDDQNNPSTISMLSLREAHGAKRLGVHVRTNISQRLAGLGLGHFPTRLADDQTELVRLYKLGSPVANVIGAVLNPNEGNDGVIRSAVEGEDAEVIEQIRELVCQ
jgi:hypothetical protein